MRKSPISQNRPGHVYLIRAQNGLYKIGCSEQVENRVERLMKSIPFHTELLHLIICTSDCHVSERALHTLMRARRRTGEWFALNEDEVAYLYMIHTMDGGLVKMTAAQAAGQRPEWEPDEHIVLAECHKPYGGLEGQYAQFAPFPGVTQPVIGKPLTTSQSTENR